MPCSLFIARSPLQCLDSTKPTTFGLQFLEAAGGEEGAQLGLFSVLLSGRAWSFPKDCSLVLNCRISSFHSSSWPKALSLQSLIFTSQHQEGLCSCVRKERAAFQECDFIHQSRSRNQWQAVHLWGIGMPPVSLSIWQPAAPLRVGAVFMGAGTGSPGVC